MKVIKYIAVLMAFGILPMSVQAAALYFDFRGGPTIDSSMMFSDGGVTLTVTAQQIDDNFPNTVSGALVSQNNNAGIGACLSMLACSRAINTDNPQLDSDGPDEVVTFAISGGSLVLDQFLFGAYAQDNAARDNFIFEVDGFCYNGCNAFHSFQDLWDVAASFGTITATNYFSFRSIANPLLSSFRITELYATENYATALPEPGTLGMLLFGLGAVGLIRRRKRS